MKPFKLDSENKISPGFKTPEAYFDTLTEKVMRQLPKHETRIIPLYKRTLVWTSAVAAVFVLALGISLLWNQGNTNTPPEEAAIQNYLAYQDNIAQDDIIQGLTQEDINELESSIAISDEAIESYLSTEDYEIYLNE